MREKKCLIVLAAGNSSRMGTCKFMLKTGAGLSFIENIICETKDFLFDRIIIVVNEKTFHEVSFVLRNHLSEKIKVILNENVERERFYSLQLGLKQLRGFDYYFVHNADNPFLNHETLSLLYRNRFNSPVILPTFNGKGGHPVLFNKIIANFLLSSNSDARLDLELKKHKVLRIESSIKEVLTNIDNREDYFRVFGKKHVA